MTTGTPRQSNHVMDVMPSPSPLPAATGSSDQMSGVYGRTFWLAYLANSALIMGNALTFRFAELVNHLGGTESDTGIIVALGTAVAVLVRLSVSHVLDDYGTRRMWPLCAMLFVAGVASFLVPADLSWVLYLARVAYFVGLTGMFACSMTHIQNHVPPERRTEIIGNLGSSGFVGMIVGSNIGDVVLRLVPDKRTQFVILFGGAAVIGLMYLVIIVLLTRDQPHPRTATSPPAFRLLIRFWPGTVVLTAMIMGLGGTATQTFLTRFATSQHIDGIAAFFSGYAISAFVFRLLVSNWSRTIGRHWMLVRGLLGHVVGHAMLAFATEWWHFIPASIVCGFGHALLFPAVVSLGSGAFPKECRGSGTAIILGFTDFGSLVFAPVLGWIIVHHGFTAMYLTSSGSALVTALLYAVVAWHYPDDEAAG